MSMTASSVRQPDQPVPGYSHVVMRDTVAGRRAYVAGTRLAVWHIVAAVQGSSDNAALIAPDYGISEDAMCEALAYARDHPAEIQAAIEDNASYTPERVMRLLPNVSVFVIPDDSQDLGGTKPR